jgi:peptidoglycan/xylan/chitin deacetylase (PgdA/CDA1 family)
MHKKYFDIVENYYHGIMFHHFHDNLKHIKTPGSITKDDFYKMVKFIGRENILDADDFLYRFKEKKLLSKNVCLTFDDGSRSQYDIGLPILNDLNIKCFFFIHTSIFTENPDLLTLYIYFRTYYFKNSDKFYELFFLHIDQDLNYFFQVQKKMIKEKQIKYPEYSINDIKFRLVRDILITKKKYSEIMLIMFKEKNFQYKSMLKALFISKNQLKKIKDQGHLIGAHTHSHPFLIEKFTQKEQSNEYKKCIKILLEILEIKKNKIKSMAHPSGSYNKNTLKVLKDLGFEIGFKNIMGIEKSKKMKKINNSFLEIARQDHSYVMKMMLS